MHGYINTGYVWEAAESLNHCQKFPSVPTDFSHVNLLKRLVVADLTSAASSSSRAKSLEGSIDDMDDIEHFNNYEESFSTNSTPKNQLRLQYIASKCKAERKSRRSTSDYVSKYFTKVQNPRL